MTGRSSISTKKWRAWAFAGAVLAACACLRLFAAEQKPAAAGGALTAEDESALRDVSAYCLGAIAGDEPDYYKIRVAVVLNRVHETLGDWDDPKLAKWYVDRVAVERHHVLQAELLKGAIATARGNADHTAGLDAFWARLDARLKAANNRLHGQAQHLRQAMGRYRKYLEQGTRPPRLSPLQVRPPDLRPPNVSHLQVDTPALGKIEKLKPIE